MIVWWMLIYQWRNIQNKGFGLFCPSESMFFNVSKQPTGPTIPSQNKVGSTCTVLVQCSMISNTARDFQSIQGTLYMYMYRSFFMMKFPTVPLSIFQKRGPLLNLYISSSISPGGVFGTNCHTRSPLYTFHNVWLAILKEEKLYPWTAFYRLMSFLVTPCQLQTNSFMTSMYVTQILVLAQVHVHLACREHCMKYS